MEAIEKKELEGQVNRAREQLQGALNEVSRLIVGQKPMLEGMFMGILAGGHVLLEGVPGLAKTLAIKALSDVLDTSFKRIQFTPDLLPADLVGTMIYRQQTGEFLPRKGPVFSNVVLADEINRAPAKVQSALLEAMEERQVTIGDNTYPLPDPFFVMATQNPIEQEGTYPLPEAQLDRFMIKLEVSYPTMEEEVTILQRLGDDQNISIQRTLSKHDIKRLREIASKVEVDERIMNYIVRVVSATRPEQDDVQIPHQLRRWIEFGASPRASMYLYRMSKVRALFQGRTFVQPEDVKFVSPLVLRHRVSLTYEAQTEDRSVDQVIAQLLNTIPVP